MSLLRPLPTPSPAHSGTSRTERERRPSRDKPTYRRERLFFLSLSLYKASPPPPPPPPPPSSLPQHTGHRGGTRGPGGNRKTRDIQHESTTRHQPAGHIPYALTRGLRQSVLCSACVCFAFGCMCCFALHCVRRVSSAVCVYFALRALIYFSLCALAFSCLCCFAFSCLRKFPLPALRCFAFRRVQWVS